MIKINFDRMFLFGLYTYLKQIELSVDRVANDSWMDLIHFFTDRIPPSLLLSHFEIKSKDKMDFSAQKNTRMICYNISDKIIAFFLRVFGKETYLYDGEVAYIYLTISKFIKLLENDYPDKKLLIELRMELNFCCEMLALKFSISEIQKAQYVEHFNQNNFLCCMPFDQIVGNDWLK